MKASTGTGIPSGDVALLATLADGSMLGIDQFTLANGAVTSTKTQNLPGGTYKVYAHYAGDGTNAPSDSPSVQVTVGKEASQTFIVIPSFDSQGNQTSGNANSVVYGSNYIIRMYVANSAAAASTTGPPTSPCYTVNEVTCPTGSVTLTASGTAVDGGTFTLNNQGYNPLVAKYAGDASYAASTSATDAFTVTPAPIPLSMIVPSSSIAGTTFFARVEGDLNFVGVAPTGTMTMLEGNTVVGGPSTVLGNVSFPGIFMNIPVMLNTSGSHSLIAKYTGDASYAGSTAAAQNIQIFYPTTSAITVSSSNINFGQSITIKATLSTGLKSPAITGQIGFGSTNGLAAITIGPTTQTTDASGNLILQASATTSPQFTESVFSTYNGDANYSSSSSNVVFVNVNIPDFTLGPSSGVNVQPVAGQAGSASLTITPTSQMPSSVALTLSGVVISGYTISLTPQQVSLNGSAVSATLSMTPMATVPANAIKAQERRASFIGFPRGDWLGLRLGAGICAVFLLIGSSRAKHSRLAQTGQGYINNPGIYQITASYSGDSQNQASSSAPLIQVLTGTFPVTIQGATGGDLHFVQGSVGVQ